MFNFKRNFTPFLAFLIIVTTSYSVYKAVLSKEETIINNAVLDVFEMTKRSITNDIDSRLQRVSQMSDRWVSKKDAPSAEWIRDANQYLQAQTGLESITWIDQELKIRWLAPSKKSKTIIESYIQSVKNQENTSNILEKNESTFISSPIELPDGSKTFTLWSPIQTAKYSSGYIVHLIEVKGSLGTLISERSENNFVIQLSDGEDLFFNSSNLEEKSVENPHLKKTFSIANRVWTLKLGPKQSFISQHTTQLPHLILATGILLGLTIASIILYNKREKQKNLMLIEKENLLSTFITHTPAAVAMFDNNMDYIAASERWYNDYGLSGKQIIGKNYYEILLSINAHRTCFKQKHQRALAGELIQADEEKFIRSDNSIGWLRYEFRRWINHNGNLGGLIIFTEDITHRKNMELMKDEFISNVNHELRTPLTSIQGSLGLLKVKFMDQFDAKGQRLINLSYDNCLRLTDLVNDILDLQKMAAGQIDFIMEPIPICKLVNSIIERHQGYAEMFQVTFQMVNHVEEVYCMADSGRFNQALTNLLSNAAKFSPVGETVTVTVDYFKIDCNNINCNNINCNNINCNNIDSKTIKPETLDNKNVAKSVDRQQKIIISVSDNGPGIPEAFKEKIFSKFAQADTSSTRAQGGTGLGLNITRSIIEAFGGKVTFDSEEGKGSTFHFILPVYDNNQMTINEHPITAKEA